MEDKTAGATALKKLSGTIPAALGLAAAARLVVIASAKSSTAMVAVAAAGGVALFCLPTVVAFALFIISTFFERIGWEIGFTFKLEYPFIMLMALVLLLRTKTGASRIPATHYPILAYLAANLISTILFSTVPMFCFMQFGLITTVTAAYFITCEYLLRHPRKMLSLFHFYLGLGVLESLYGVISFALLRFGVYTGGAYLTGYGQYYVNGTMLEGNIFGGMAAMQGLFLFNLAQSRHVPEAKRKWLWAGVILHVAALVMSNTRTAWVGFIVGVAVTMFMGGQRRLIARALSHWRTALAVAAGVAIFIWVATLTHVVDPSAYTSRFAMIFTPGKENTIMVRMENIKNSIVYWKEHPVMGNGTGSYRSMFEQRAWQQKGWVSNQFVLSLQDTGLVGVAIIVWLLYATFFPFPPVLKARRESPEHPYLLGFFSALVCIWICFQVTTGTWLGYFWVVFGFAAAFLETCRDGENKLTRGADAPS